jgi:hypothetical protein
MMRPMPGGPALIRRVFESLFGATVAPADTAEHLADRVEITADILARDLSEDPGRGFRWKTRIDLLPMAQHWTFMAWLVRTGRWQSDTTAEVESSGSPSGSLPTHKDRR